MRVMLYPDGRLVVPVRVEGQGTIGDTCRFVLPGDGDYLKWLTAAVAVPAASSSSLLEPDPGDA